MRNAMCTQKRIQSESNVKYSRIPPILVSRFGWLNRQTCQTYNQTNTNLKAVCNGSPCTGTVVYPGHGRSSERGYVPHNAGTDTTASRRLTAWSRRLLPHIPRSLPDNRVINMQTGDPSLFHPGGMELNWPIAPWTTRKHPMIGRMHLTKVVTVSRFQKQNENREMLFSKSPHV